MGNNVLIAGDWELRWGLRSALIGAGFEVTVAASGEEATSRFREDHPDVVLLDMGVCVRNGLLVFNDMRKESPDAKVVLITDAESTDAAAAVQLGAYGMVKKPLELDDIVATVRNAARATTLEKRVAYFVSEERKRGAAANFVHAAPVTNRLLRQVQAIASQTSPTVLVTGEPGSGKSAVTRVLHEESAQAMGPFVEVNCAAIHDLELELYGRGRRFVGDEDDHKIGLVEIADGGTLAFSDVAELSPSAQAALSSFLEHRSFRRAGVITQHRVNVRVIASSSRNLPALVAANRFRSDLYGALSAVVVHVAPLCERRADIAPLMNQFLSQTVAELGQGFSGASPETLRVLERYRWPGNVRELRTMIRRAAFVHEASILEPHHLPAEILAGIRGTDGRKPATAIDAQAWRPAQEEIDAGHIRWVLEICEGNASLAAQYLGTTRQNLIKQLQIAEAFEARVDRD